MNFKLDKIYKRKLVYERNEFIMEMYVYYNHQTKWIEAISIFTKIRGKEKLSILSISIQNSCSSINASTSMF